MWNIEPLDVVKEKITSSMSWETGEINLSGTLHTKNEIVYRVSYSFKVPYLVYVCTVVHKD